MAGTDETFAEFSPATWIIEHTNEMWIVVGPDWRIRFLNRAAGQIARHGCEGAKGRILWEELPDQRDTVFQEHYERVMATRQQEQVVAYYAPNDRWYNVCAIPVSEIGGMAIGLSDVTDTVLTEQDREKRIRESEARLRLATGAAEVGIWEYSVPEKRLIVSPLGLRLFGVSSQGPEVGVDDVLAKVHPDDRERAREAARAALVEGRDLNVEYRAEWPDGATHWLASRATRALDDDGNPVRLYGTVIDMSERKRAEDELMRQAEQLARSNADLQQFAYVTSHDMQEPLRGIASFAQLLGQRYRGKLDQDADEFITYIITGVRRMSTLIDDLLVYSRVVNIERTPPAPVDLNGVVQWAKMNLQQALAESRGHISQENLPMITGDQVQFVQLMQNLLSNAIKYHRRDVPPHIRITAERQGDHWLFGIHDNGVGIEPQFHDRVFGLFKRLHGRDVPGTGIGLAICRKIVEQHNGRMWVESRPGRGSTFYFTLPA